MINVEQAFNLFSRDEFYHKFGNTLALLDAGIFAETPQFVLMNKTDGKYVVVHRANDQWDTFQDTVEKGNFKKVKVGNILPRFFNSKEGKQAFYLHQLPARVTKHGLDLRQNSKLDSAFWNSIPRPLRSELVRTPIGEFTNGVGEHWATELTIMNWHFPSSFINAVEQIAELEFYSLAFHQQWALGYTAHSDKIGVFFRSIRVGNINLEDKSVQILEPILAQELQDLFNREGIQWRVNV